MKLILLSGLLRAFALAMTFFFSFLTEASSLSPCQQAFINGYNAYKDGNNDSAKKYFSECDKKYPLLQKYISKFLKDIENGVDFFKYEEKVPPNFEELEPFELAKAYFSARRYKEAANMFEKTAEVKKYRLSSLEYLATSLARQGKNAEAMDIQKKIAEEFRRNRAARSKALYKIGFLYLDFGEYQNAKEAFLKLHKIYSGYKKNQARWQIAWCDYKLGNFESAVHSFKELEKENGWRLRAKFWHAMSLERAGKKAMADEIYNKLSAEKNYYGIISGQKSGRGGALPPPVRRAEPRRMAGLSPPDTLATARELSALGLKELAAVELEGLKNNFNPDEFYRLAEINDAWRAIFLKFEPYPNAYPKIVPPLAKKHNIDPLFALAVMREESKFKADAISRSGAIGLMQLMPATAERMLISKDIAKNHPLRPKRLIEPELNIKAGIRYLDFLSRRYKNNIYYIAAGYNAGEEAVDRWLSFSKGGEEGFGFLEFAEEIPYKETHEYVKKVMASYWMYQLTFNENVP